MTGIWFLVAWGGLQWIGPLPEHDWWWAAGRDRVGPGSDLPGGVGANHMRGAARSGVGHDVPGL